MAYGSVVLRRLTHKLHTFCVQCSTPKVHENVSVRPSRPSSPSSPFVVDDNVDRKVKAQQGMAAAGPREEKGLYIDLNIEDQLNDVEQGERSRMGDIIMKAVEAAVKAAIPAIVKAVKDVCLTAVKEEINPHLLRMQCTWMTKNSTLGGKTSGSAACRSQRGKNQRKS